jgi:hypothetical protein
VEVDLYLHLEKFHPGDPDWIGYSGPRVIPPKNRGVHK